MNNATITVELSPDHAQALAQFLKRIGWQDCRNLAKHDEEAYLQQESLFEIQKQLTDAGYAPR